MSDEDFLRRLKVALRGDADAPLVFLGNFEVEDRWAEDEPGLPRFSMRSAGAVVDRMDEFAVLLAGEDDHVILKGRPDEDYLTYLSDLGVGLPRVLAVGEQRPGRTVTQDVLADPALVARLGELQAEGACLLPHGVSEQEESLASASGMAVAGSSAKICKAVNSKIYSRLLADEAGLRQPTGWTCPDVDSWDGAVRGARAVLADGGTIAVKDAFGVSGKGIMVIRDEQVLLHLDRKLRRRAERTGDGRLTLTVETWVGKRADLNYQLTVGRDGSVGFDFVKEAITVDGVHKGHRMPADLSAAQHEEIRAAAQAVGRRLAADGYLGVVGVDGLVGTDGRLFPVIEINARSNMSTYQVRLQEAFLSEGRHAMAAQYPLRLGGRLEFWRLRAALGELLATRVQDTGVLINNFATVNAAADEGPAPFHGRLYALLVAGSPDELAVLDEQLRHRLAGVAEATAA
ncbi:hypothetical protein [Catellatospora sp. NPDC049133]|jgi:hypothetical protein|uniref:preATP grasp domain-containing protein n=1 Tax=Catellatospora sp. NPDC049133 TaxID=3155499 RepID=UPI0033D68AE5